MKIEQYISQLLYRYQCVTVPGFGAFLTELQPSRVTEASNVFYPPTKSLAFNAYLKNNDGLLANHIANAAKTSYEDAVQLIANEVLTWKSSLETSKKFTLADIGELTLNAEQNLVFTPYDQPNYLPQSFGLVSFVSPSVKREIYKQEAEAFEEKAPVAFTAEKRKSYAYLKYAAVLVVALSATGILGLKQYNSNVAKQTLLVQQDVQREVEQQIQQATFVINNPLPAVTLTLEDKKMPYHVVAGAFRQEENAIKAYEQLVQLGYASKRLEPNQYGLHPVLYGSYTTYREAFEAMAQIRRAHNKDAWLLIKEF
jgi:hypothetical protein